MGVPGATSPILDITCPCGVNGALKPRATLCVGVPLASPGNEKTSVGEWGLVISAGDGRVNPTECECTRVTPDAENGSAGDACVGVCKRVTSDGVPGGPRRVGNEECSAGDCIVAEADGSCGAGADGARTLVLNHFREASVPGP